MNRITLWKTKLKAAKAELRISVREANAAKRSLDRIKITILELEAKIAAHMEKS